MALYIDAFTGRAVGPAFRILGPNRLVREWQHRMRSRHELALLSRSELKDIGYPPSITLESSKPSWIE
jgi:uncharacterized protein YjiS (DUF1127 family)